MLQNSGDLRMPVFVGSSPTSKYCVSHAASNERYANTGYTGRPAEVIEDLAKHGAADKAAGEIARRDKCRWPQRDLFLLRG